MSNFSIVTSLVIIGFILVLSFLYYYNTKQSNPFCSSLLLKLTPACWISSIFIDAGNKQGSDCVIDSDCLGWSIGGKIACCGSRCITKSNPFETCIGYCIDHDCGRTGRSQCTIGTDCEGWSVIGRVECIGDVGTQGIAFIKNGRCVTKDSDFQTLPQFWDKYGSGVDWCKSHNRSSNATEDIFDTRIEDITNAGIEDIFYAQTDI